MEPVSIVLLAAGGYALYKIVTAPRANETVDPALRDPRDPLAPSGGGTSSNLAPGGASSSVAPSDGWLSGSGTPFDLFGGLGGFSSSGDSGGVDGGIRDIFGGMGGILDDGAKRSALNVALPKGYSIRRASGADAPIAHGDRVLVDVIREGTHHHSTLEGSWEGTTDLEQPGWVNVDRIADRANEGADLPFGRYRIPESEASGYHQYLAGHVTWFPVTPESAGLKRFAGKLPTLAIGDRLTAVLRDTRSNIVIALVEISGNPNSATRTVIPRSVYRVLVDEGKGTIRIPAKPMQLGADMIVDAASIPKIAAATKGAGGALTGGAIFEADTAPSDEGHAPLREIKPIFATDDGREPIRCSDAAAYLPEPQRGMFKLAVQYAEDGDVVPATEMRAQLYAGTFYEYLNLEASREIARCLSDIIDGRTIAKPLACPDAINALPNALRGQVRLALALLESNADDGAAMEVFASLASSGVAGVLREQVSKCLLGAAGRDMTCSEAMGRVDSPLRSALGLAMTRARSGDAWDARTLIAQLTTRDSSLGSISTPLRHALLRCLRDAAAGDYATSAPASPPTARVAPQRTILSRMVRGWGYREPRKS